MSTPAQFDFNTDIIGVLNDYVNKQALKIYSADKCPPIFQVSLFFNEYDEHNIILAINHNCCHFSKIIFPQPSKAYGYDSLKLEMDSLYIKTL